MNLKILITLNILATILLLLVFGTHFKMYPLHLPYYKFIKPIINPELASLKDYLPFTKDKEMEEEIDKFWEETLKQMKAERSETYKFDYGNEYVFEDEGELVNWKESLYWLERVKKGGLIIFFRHGEREKWSEALSGFDAYELYNNIDARDTDWYRAVCLTERGIETSKITGRAFKHAGIKVQEVISSPSCRARETAVHTFGRIDQIHSSLLHRVALNPLDRYAYGMDLKDFLLDYDLDEDKNLVLSSHNSTVDYPDFIDEWNDHVGLEEGGFYIIEKKDNKLIMRYRFFQSGRFNMLIYRNDPVRKKCSEPTKLENECTIM
ncbi:histidine phosphatase family protein [Pelagibacteraceae bacterium]|nr:histidine phosphatase family protein [Pelagibacteraceae bacterium]